MRRYVGDPELSLTAAEWANLWPLIAFARTELQARGVLPQLTRARREIVAVAAFLQEHAERGCVAATGSTVDVASRGTIRKLESVPADVDVPTAAARVGCSQAYVRRIAPDIPGARLIGGRWRIPTAALDALAANRRKHRRTTS